MTNWSAEANCAWVEMRVAQAGLATDTEAQALVIIEVREELELL